MPKTKISEFSATPGNNTDIDGINLAEGCAPSGINDAIRELMAQLKDFQAGTAGDSFNGPVGTTTAAAGAFTTLTTSSTVTHNGGTANGVAYLNGSKVLTTGSALTFDGSFLNLSRGSAGTLLNLTDGVAQTLRIATTASAATIDNPSAGALGFLIAGSEQARLTSTGLGIGTSSPGRPLDVIRGTAGFVSRMGFSSGVSIYQYTDANAAYISTATNLYNAFGINETSSYLNFYTANAERARLDSSGNLGIGTSSPSVKLDVVGAINATSNITSGGILQALTTVQSSSGADLSLNANGANRDIIYKVNATELMRLVGSSGNLGIGTSSPATKLEVSGSAAAARVSGTAGSVPQLQLSSSGVVNWSLRSNNDGASDFTIYQDATQRLKIDSSGNLGLGVTPSAWGTSEYKAVQVGNGASFYGRVASGDQDKAGMSSNAYNNGSNWLYIATDSAAKYDQIGGGHYWYTAASGTAGNAISFTQAMTLDASGNLGVGTTSPIQKLQVNGTAVLFNNTAGTFDLQLYQTNRYDGRITVNSSGFEISQRQALPLLFLTSDTERARITSGGAWQVGTSGVYTEHATVQRAANEYTTTFVSPRATAAQNFGLQVTYSAADPNGTGNFFLYCEANGTIRANIRSNGGIANYSANNVNLSDRREKTNFAPAKSYIDAICAIPVQTFNYVDQNMEEDPGLTLGVVAQDVQAVAPELVMESNWAKEGEDPKMRLSIYQTDLQYALMKCIQEQQVMINELKAEVAALKAK